MGFGRVAILPVFLVFFLIWMHSKFFSQRHSIPLWQKSQFPCPHSKFQSAGIIIVVVVVVAGVVVVVVVVVGVVVVVVVVVVVAVAVVVVVVVVVAGGVGVGS